MAEWKDSLCTNSFWDYLIWRLLSATFWPLLLMTITTWYLELLERHRKSKRIIQLQITHQKYEVFSCNNTYSDWEEIVYCPPALESMEATFSSAVKLVIFVNILDFFSNCQHQIRKMWLSTVEFFHPQNTSFYLHHESSWLFTFSKRKFWLNLILWCSFPIGVVLLWFFKLNKKMHVQSSK